MNSKAIKWGSIIVVLIFIFLWITVYIEKPDAVLEEQAPIGATAVIETHPTYTDPAGYSVSYPEGFTVSTSTDNELFAKGVSFIVPKSLTEGTNLSTDSRIYIEAILGTSTCNALAAHVDAGAAPGSMEESVAFGGTTYRTLTYSEAGAGNFYETDVYALLKGEACYEISRFIHSSNLANYEPGAVREFDRSSLDAAIKLVLESFKPQ